MNDDSRTLDFFLRVIRRRWGLIIGCAVLVCACALAFSMLQTSQYTASASLLFRDTQFDQELFGTNFTPTINDPAAQQATNIELVSLPTVAARTGAALHLPNDVVSTETSVAGVGQSNITSISVTDPSPVRAARIANTYAQQYVLFRQQADRSKIAGAQQLVQREISGLTTAQRYSSVGQSLVNRANQLGVLAALQTGNAEVVQPASVPTSPSTPKTSRNGALGLMLGLLLGVGLAFGRERFDRRMREPSALEDAYQVPLLGVVPDSTAYTGSALRPLPAAEAEAFALLRARLRYFNVDREVRSLLVTSAAPNEGKTTVAVNLAIAEVIAGHQRVVIVDADLRRPTLARRLEIAPQPGLAEILSRNATLESALREVQIPTRALTNGRGPRLSVITAGAVPPNPGELVESRAMIDLLSSLAERFDLVVIDSPPTSIVSDAMPIIRLVSGVVIVGRIDHARRDSAEHLHDQLVRLHSPTLGVIANAMPLRGGDGYGYGYGYGAEYYAADEEHESGPEMAQAESDTQKTRSDELRAELECVEAKPGQNEPGTEEVGRPVVIGSGSEVGGAPVDRDTNPAPDADSAH